MEKYINTIVKIAGRSATLTRFSIMKGCVDKTIKHLKDKDIKTASCLSDISEYLSKSIDYLNKMD